MNWLDLGIILLCFILVILSIKRGFMSSVLSNFNLSVNAFLSFFLCKPLASFLNLFSLQGAIETVYKEKMLAYSADFGKNLMEISEGELSGFVTNTINSSNLTGVSKFMFNRYANTSSLYSTLHSSNLESRTLANIVSESLSQFFTLIISFVISLVLIYIVLKVLEKIVDKLRSIGSVKVVDGILGAVYGIFRCLVVVTVLCLIVKLMSPLSFMTSVTDYISSSFFGKTIYQPINQFIDKCLDFQKIINTLFPK